MCLKHPDYELDRNSQFVSLFPTLFKHLLGTQCISLRYLLKQYKFFNEHLEKKTIKVGVT